MSEPQVNPPSFPAQAASFIMSGPAGDLDVATEVPAASHALAGTAIVCHPHPLHGGTMQNKVVTMVERSLRELGLRTVRFNFRGVGASTGEFDEGRGELEDLLAIAAWVRQVRPDDVLWLAGFSFGSYVAAKAERHLPVEQLILIAPPVDKYAFAALANPSCPWLVVQGEDDDVVSAAAVFEWIAQLRDPPTLVRMPGTGHFFHRKLMDLRGAIKHAVKANLPTPLPELAPAMAHTERAAGRLPSSAYAEGAAAGEWQDDAAQRAVLPALDRIHRELEGGARASVIERVRGWFGTPQAVRGLYLYGGVGRGKTFLIDLLHDSAPEPLRLRLHFHRFMGRVHAELGKLKPQRDPLREIARRFAERPLLCLDEFFVQDIGDAMILAELLKHLGQLGASLVTTSNIAPRALYHDGLQRTRFLPAIAWIERHCEVLELASATDYRLRALTRAPTYQQPLGAPAERALAEIFDQIAPGSLRPEPSMLVNDRPLALKRRADGIAWFEFAALCEGPRAVADYIELAKSYNTVLVSNVPRFDALRDDAAKRFVHLVDEFYDRNVNLVLSAAAPVEDLYAGERLHGEFARTRSRLIEMQSREYLGREHRP